MALRRALADVVCDEVVGREVFKPRPQDCHGKKTGGRDDEPCIAGRPARVARRWGGRGRTAARRSLSPCQGLFSHLCGLVLEQQVQLIPVAGALVAAFDALPAGGRRLVALKSISGCIDGLIEDGTHSDLPRAALGASLGRLAAIHHAAGRHKRSNQRCGVSGKWKDGTKALDALVHSIQTGTELGVTAERCSLSWWSLGRGSAQAAWKISFPPAARSDKHGFHVTPRFLSLRCVSSDFVSCQSISTIQAAILSSHTSPPKDNSVYSGCECRHRRFARGASLQMLAGRC